MGTWRGRCPGIERCDLESWGEEEEDDRLVAQTTGQEQDPFLDPKES
jgi:hypothetical protein